MRTVEAVRVSSPLDCWLTLWAAGAVSMLSVRTLREYLDHPAHPLPHIRIGEPGGRLGKKGKPVRGGKVLVRASDLSNWLEGFRVQRTEPREVRGIVEQAVDEVTGRPRRGA